MNECIICRKKTDNFSDEHVIPDALGGYYHIYSVCKRCNSKLGNCVDSKLINHLFSTFERFTLGLKGKRGKIPNPFSGTHTLKNDDFQKVRLEVDNNGKFLPRYIPKIEEKILNGKPLISVTIDNRDSNKLPHILNKIAKKYNVNPNEMKSEEILNQKDSEISIALSVDFEEFKIGLLKIAYEFAVDSIPIYYQDNQAKIISKYLYNCKVEDKSLFFGSGFEDKIFQNLKWMFNTHSKKQYLILINVEQYGLICIIYLSNYISIAIKLSDKKYIHQDFIVGINDIENQKFEKFDGNSILNQLYAPSRLRFQYWFETENEFAKFNTLQMNHEISFYKINNKQPLFNRIGNIVYSDINQKIEKSMHIDKIKEIKTSNHDMVDEICLEDEELYIRFNSYPNLVRVLKIRNEQKFMGAI